MKTSHVWELIKYANIDPPHSIEQHFQWPGGRGIMSVDMDATGESAKIIIGQVNSLDVLIGWNMRNPALSFNGTSEILETGDYYIDLPPCFINMGVSLEGESHLTISDWKIIKYCDEYTPLEEESKNPMQQFKSLEIISTVNITAPATIERDFQWPGGRGYINIEMTPSGPSAKIDIQGIFGLASLENGESGWGIYPPKLSPSGVDEITETGSYFVDLPPCIIRFKIQLSDTDTLVISSWQAVRID